MPSRTSVPLLTVANLLIPIAILTFASGFFPYKPFLPGTATFMYGNADRVPEAPFDKVVFLVVDALRRLVGTSCLFYAVGKRLIQAAISFTPLTRGLTSPKGRL